MIQFKTIDGLLLRDMVMAGAALLEKNRETVDALNVFPVPDGDTGTNMSLTMASATREINSKEFLRADEAAAALAKGALKGARGNSGVITSQLYRGFSRALDGVDKITPIQFAKALKNGAGYCLQGRNEAQGRHHPHSGPGYCRGRDQAGGSTSR